jgi:hypothetical protein
VRPSFNPIIENGSPICRMAWISCSRLMYTPSLLK